MTLKAGIMAGRAPFASTYRPICYSSPACLLLRSTPTQTEERGGVVQYSNARKEEVCQLPAATAASRVHGMALLTFMPSRRPMHMRRSASELKQLSS